MVRTAHAIGIDPIHVLRLADEEHWAEKLKPIIELKTSSKPGDVERAINRALNFVMAHKVRLFLGRVLQKVVGFTDEQVEDYFLSEATGPMANVKRRVSAKGLADLMTAVEKCQHLTYMALNDTATERQRRGDDVQTEAAGELHVRIAKAMSEVKLSSSLRARLADAQLAQAGVLAGVKSKHPAEGSGK